MVEKSIVFDVVFDDGHREMYTVKFVPECLDGLTPEDVANYMRAKIGNLMFKIAYDAVHLHGEPECQKA